jgi:hypothetical protein
LVQDPVYFITIAFFAVLTTALPAGLGQPRFLPIIQALSLTIFAAIAIRRGNMRVALFVTGLWVSIQFAVIALLTFFVPGQVERAVVDGFDHRRALLEWLYTGQLFPSGLAINSVAYLTEALGIILGAVLTGGLVGAWFFMRLVNLAGYTSGALAMAAIGPFAALLPLPVWMLLRVAAYGCLWPLAASPLLTGIWSPPALWRTYRRQLLIGLGLLLVALISEWLLAGWWPSLLPEL